MRLAASDCKALPVFPQWHGRARESPRGHCSLRAWPASWGTIGARYNRECRRPNARNTMLNRHIRSLILALFALTLAVAGAARAIAASPGEPAVLLVFGDSISAGYGLPAGTGWVTLLTARLQAQGYRYTVVNDRPVLVDPRTRRIVEVVE